MRDIALTAFILGCLPVFFLRPWTGILGWYWLGLMNPHRLSWGFAFGMPFALLIGAATLAGLFVTKEKKPIPWNAELVCLLLLSFGYTLSSFLAWVPDSAWPEWERTMKIILMAFVTTKLIFGRERIRYLLIVIGLSIGFYGFKGGVFSFRGGGVDHVWGPPGSFIEDNNFLGLAMVMVVPILIFLAREEQKKWLRRLFYLTAFLSGVASIFTYSRGALLGLVVVFSLTFFRSNKKFLVILLAIPLAIYGKELLPKQLTSRYETIQTYKKDDSAMERIQAWGVGWNVALENPLTGGGFEFNADQARWLSHSDPKYFAMGPKFNVSREAHSAYFQTAGQHGFVALGVFLAMLMFTLIRLQKMRRHALKYPEHAWIGNYAAAIQIGLFGYIVSGAFINVANFDLMYAYVVITAILDREFRQLSLPAREFGQVRFQKGAKAAGTV